MRGPAATEETGRQFWLWCGQAHSSRCLRVRLRQTTLEKIERWAWTDEGPLWPMWASDTAFRQDWYRIVVLATVQQFPIAPDAF